MDPSTLSDVEFLAGFEACTLPPTAFNHVGHLRVSWICLQRFSPEEAERRVCEGIARFAAALGVPQKYNLTLTVALVRLMAHAGAGDPARSFTAFLAAQRELVDDAQGVLARHYSAARLGSPEAKGAFVAPDLSPLPA